MTLLARIQDSSERLTRSDRRIIEILLGQQSEAVFLSAAQLAERAEVHETTATRLAQKLGFSGYPELRAQLQRELLSGQDAAARMRKSVAKVADGSYLADLVQSELAALEQLTRCVAQGDVDIAADMIVAARRIFIFAQGHATSVSAFLQRRLDRFGMATVTLTGRGRDIAERLTSLGPQDLILILAFRKQPRDYAAVMGHAARMGAGSLLISDLAGPTMVPAAGHLLAAPRGRSGTEFQTPIVPMTIVNAILLTIAGRHETQVVAKLEELAGLFDRFE
ncbi:MAG: MurR/RpiR family transcriptional regulator [Tropicimonas sp.]|uniref:MurR/RpiR family transcriptional regulator n=1 Tax=Tropicimonas sp. TaxID=2067044 RepID=UPI003A8AC1A6